LSERKLWRPALDALRLSLDQKEVAEVRGQYEKLRDEKGFRLLDYSVDSDSASPRACSSSRKNCPSAPTSIRSSRWQGPIARR
jgi:hypothetical protein